MNNFSSDRMIRAVAQGGELRATILLTTQLVNELRRRHGMSPLVAAATGRVAASALLLSTALKDEQVVTVEIHGEGPLDFLRATADARGGVRAYASRAEVEEVASSVAQAIGAEGHLRVSRDLGFGDPYHGITPLITGNVAHDVAFYYHNSEQIRSALALDELFDVERDAFTAVGGFLVQAMPPVDDSEQAELRMLALAERMADDVEALPPLRELLADGLDVEALLGRIFPEGFTVVDESAITFRCACTRERFATGLEMIGPVELRRILEEEGDPLEARCHFCGDVYRFSAVELEALFSRR